ncbi:voltage-gated chloride channel family protein [Sphingobacterium bovistauri]|uniref:voltage-gated chloride channel family protein n=1 Tax=Sphingobacterium bovistauri TaxID=2781959 RepID=UPI001CE2193F|nr:voltage-gated chloride channel family protein [Sphingobacterium bovistauri]
MLKLLFISLLLSLLVGSASAGFLISLDWVTDYREEHLWIILFLPIAGFSVSWVYLRYGKNVEQGNNLLIDTIHDGGERIPFRMAPLIYIGTILTHLFGGSAGREGTALQMAGAIADQFSKPFRLSKEDRSTLLLSAIAGGFGAVFGTPLAGMVFALEFNHLGKLNYRAIFPVLMTAVLSDQVCKLWNAEHTAYYIDIVPKLTFAGIAYSLLAGIIFGLCATVFIRFMHEASKLWKRYIVFSPLRALLAGLFVVSGVYLLGTTKYIGLGIPMIELSFEQQQLPYDFALKLLFTVVTLSAGFKGGEVTPLFFIGATLGNALSLFIPLQMGLLAGMGFVAVFAGATNTPIACTLMAIELFGADSAVYVAIACVVSYIFSGKLSIYTSQRMT